MASKSQNSYWIEAVGFDIVKESAAAVEVGLAGRMEWKRVKCRTPSRMIEWKACRRLE